MQVVLTQAIAGLGDEHDPVEVDDAYGENLIDGGWAVHAEKVLPSESWTLPDLRKFAEDHGVDLAGARSKAAVLEAINAAPQAQQPGSGVGGEDTE